jgi:hypothetical protein
MLESIEGYSFVGCWKECGDGIQRFLFPFVFALSADYEEQCVFHDLLGKSAESLSDVSWLSYVAYGVTVLVPSVLFHKKDRVIILPSGNDEPWMGHVGLSRGKISSQKLQLKSF